MRELFVTTRHYRVKQMQQGNSFVINDYDYPSISKNCETFNRKPNKTSVHDSSEILVTRYLSCHSENPPFIALNMFIILTGDTQILRNHGEIRNHQLHTATRLTHQL